MKYVEQYIRRAPWRRQLGSLYYRYERYLSDFIKRPQFAKQGAKPQQLFTIKEHSSLILRPLKDVDMVLQENKRTNLRLAIQHLNGLIIRPKELLSVWHQVGKPSKRKGYLEGLVLREGKIDKGIGGGLCQLGNLLFWLFAHSPLMIAERHRHSFDVFPDVNRRIPFGAGATLSYNYIDFRVLNQTDDSYYLELWLDDTHLWGRLSIMNRPCEVQYSIEERGHQVVAQPWGGYTRHNQIVQIATYPDGVRTERLLVENHAIMMYNPILYPPKQ